MRGPTINPVVRAKGPKKGGCLTSGLISLGILLFCATMLTVIVAVGIWPGEAKLTAPIVCPDDQPDPFVVADTYQTQPGETTTNFTLYCMGERGDVSDQGFARPFFLLTAFHLVLIVVLIFVFGLLGRLARGGGGGPGPQPMPAAPGPEPATAPSPDESSQNETDFEPPGPIIS